MKKQYIVIGCLAWIFYYGTFLPWSNFFWISDCTFALMFATLYYESRFLGSMVALSLFVELGWWIEFLVGLIHPPDADAADHNKQDPVGYMFDPTIPAHLRIFSLSFHILLPVMSVYFLRRFGYDPRALSYQLILGWTAVVGARVWSPPENNVNLVFSVEPYGWIIVAVVLSFLFIFSDACFRRLGRRGRLCLLASRDEA